MTNHVNTQWMSTFAFNYLKLLKESAAWFLQTDNMELAHHAMALTRFADGEWTGDDLPNIHTTAQAAYDAAYNHPRQKELAHNIHGTSEAAIAFRTVNGGKMNEVWAEWGYYTDLYGAAKWLRKLTPEDFEPDPVATVGETLEYCMEGSIDELKNAGFGQYATQLKALSDKWKRELDNTSQESQPDELQWTEGNSLTDAELAKVDGMVSHLLETEAHADFWKRLAVNDPHPDDLLNHWGLRFAWAVMETIRKEQKEGNANG